MIWRIIAEFNGHWSYKLVLNGLTLGVYNTWAEANAERKKIKGVKG